MEKMMKPETHMLEECFTVTEVKEDDLVCGIEVAPSLHCENETVSTVPITLEDHSSSWSLSSHSLEEEMGEAEMYVHSYSTLEHSLILDQPTIQSYSNGPSSPVYGRTKKRHRAVVSNRREQQYPSLIDVLFHELDEEVRKANQQGHTQTMEQRDEPVDTVVVPIPQRDGEVINLIDPNPEPLPCNMLSANFSQLQRVSLDNIDVKALLGSGFAGFCRHFATSSNEVPTTTTGRAPGNLIEPLFDLEYQNQIRVSVESIVLNEILPTLFSDDEDDSLSAIRANVQNLCNKVTALKKLESGSSQDEESEESEDDQETPLCQISSPASSSLESEDMFRDKELCQIMKTTRGGKDTSVLFPPMSFESIQTCESDDGLEDELDALDNIEDDIRKEIEAAEHILKCISQATSEESSSSASTDTPDELPKSILHSPDEQERTRSRHRVRFAEHNEEFYFVGDTSSTSSESLDGYDVQTAIEDFRMVCEDLIDEITLAITNAVESSRPTARSITNAIERSRPSSRSVRRGVKVRRSTVHYF